MMGLKSSPSALTSSVHSGLGWPGCHPETRSFITCGEGEGAGEGAGEGGGEGGGAGGGQECTGLAMGLGLLDPTSSASQSSTSHAPASISSLSWPGSHSVAPRKNLKRPSARLESAT